MATTFKAECSRFNGIGETNTPGGIRSWLDRYFMQNKRQVTFLIDETEEGFAVDVKADDHPLEDVMTRRRLHHAEWRYYANLPSYAT